MLLADVVATSRTVAATRSRKEKVAALAQLLRRAMVAGPDEAEIVVSYLGGTLRQRRTGLGWRGVSTLPPPAAEPSLTVAEVDQAFEALSRLSGAGSQAARREAVESLFGRATAEEQAWLQGVVTGNLRQGALDALVQEAVAEVTAIPLRDVRRAAMLSGSTLTAAVTAFHGARARSPPSGSRWAARSCPCSPPARRTSRPPWPRRPAVARWPSTPSSTASASRCTATETTSSW